MYTEEYQSINLLGQNQKCILCSQTEFKDTLFNKKIIRHKIKRIQSKKQRMVTYEINKISLSCFDDKRFYLNDRIQMLA